MKYKELKDPDTVLKQGDEYIAREELFNRPNPTWQKEYVSLGHKIKEYPDHAFRRPEPVPVEVKLNSTYTAKIYSDKVVVNNCVNATFTFDAVQYLASMVNKVISGEHAKEIRQAVSVEKAV